MRTFNASELAAIFADNLLAPIAQDIQLSRIITDTRQIHRQDCRRGDVFAAISGEQFDGHQFAATAVEKGLSVLLVEQLQQTTAAQIVVADTRRALGQLAAKIRDEFVAKGGKVVGLTGSVGKTTNKQMLAAILSQVGKTHATKGNLNNDLGVPFTWFDLPADAKFAVIEMGANHQGEIAYLANITRPQVAMITNAGEAHLEGFGGLDGVAKGKGELFAQLAATDTAILNIDDDYNDYWRGLIADEVSVWTFALHNSAADVYAAEIAANGSIFTLCHGEQRVVVSLPTVGRHNVMNAVACAACALSLGVSLSAIAAGLAVFETAKGRLQKHELAANSLTVIDDTYNANPMSMRASAEIVADSDGYRILLLGDMGELGDDELMLHGRLGADIADKADIFFCLGQRMRAFVETNNKAKHYTDEAQLFAALAKHIADKKQQQHVTILVKGSRSMQMEGLVSRLLEKF